ncbi:MAG: hypothetical protein MN733_22845, partial [Nitrososphaera sp.]|nr:hypothetical protein [Nitrososphaera sp.]
MHSLHQTFRIVALIAVFFFISPSPTIAAWSDEFDGTTFSLDVSGNGVNKWYWRWYKYDFNRLASNSDDYFKMHDNASYNGGPTPAAALSGTGLYGPG